MNKLQKQKLEEHNQAMISKPKVKKYFLATSDKNYETKKQKVARKLKPNYAN